MLVSDEVQDFTQPFNTPNHAEPLQENNRFSTPLQPYADELLQPQHRYRQASTPQLQQPPGCPELVTQDF